MRIGFTGTQNGMTGNQKEAIRDWIKTHSKFTQHITEVHHGDCIGADASFVELMRELCPNAKVVCHPPSNPNKRAYVPSDTTFEPKDYLTRNKDIVANSDLIIAAPKGTKEEIRSGTWSTIRYAHKTAVDIFVFYPNGYWHYYV